MSVIQEQRYNRLSNKQANSKINLAFQLKKVKAPLFVVNLVATDKARYKLYSTYLAFKALAPSGEIFSYSGKANDIAALFGISPKTLHNRVAALIKLGLLERTLKRLTIAPYTALNALHPNEAVQYAFVRVREGIPLEYYLRTINIKQSLKKQTHVVVNLIKRFDDVDTLTAIRKLGEYRSSIKTAFENNTPVKGATPPCNVDIAVSQRKIAILYNLKSQSSGWYWTYRFARLNILEVANRSITSEARTREKNAPRFGRYKYNQTAHVSFITLCNSLTFYR